VIKDRTPYRGARLLFAVAAMASAALVVGAQERTPPALAPTSHPPLPGVASQYWFVPDTSDSQTAARGEGTQARFARGVRLIENHELESGQALIDATALANTPIGAYAFYYRGVAMLGLDRYAEADTAFASVAALRPQGLLKEALALRLAELAQARGDAKKAVDILDRLSNDKLSAPEDVLLQLGRAAERAGDRDKAVKAYRRVYYDYALSAQAADAQAGLERTQTADLIPADRFKQELGRAGRLFDARRWAQARAAYEPLSRTAQGDDAELVGLRIAECDYYLDRARAARDELRPYQKGISRQAEARFFYLTAIRSLGDRETYVQLAQSFLDDFPTSAWAEEVLNNLASHFIIEDDDDAADATFRDLYRRFPESRYAERAAWKIGWRAYRSGNYREAAEIFEEAAANYPRADYRPSWLYWAGRARDRMNDQPTASARYQLVVADYENSYYGRLASKLLIARNEEPTLQTVAVATSPVALPTAIPTDSVIRALVGLELYDVALREVQYAQRVWGNSPQLEATVAFIRHNQGLELDGFDRFNALRGAITTMRRAYPQFMAAGGEDLPPDVLRIIFPLDYWPLITKYSEQYDLDPFVIAALMAQESTFSPQVRSSANAYGLMQLIPSTARQYARKLGMRYSTALLTQPEANVRIGVRYFKDLVDRFGGVYLALASYNGGRVERWRTENPDLSQDEFIDDIPYPETQNYVKRILGTAEDYRRLYGGGLLDPNESLHVTGKAMTPSRAVKSTRPAKSSKKVAPKKSTSKPTTRKAPSKRRLR
jgi:soluble lytic murein transglycosylase